MPTENYRMVRLMLKHKTAVVVKRTPFTIRLTTRTKTYVQPVILGVDAGSKTVGLSASTNTKELFSAEVFLRNDVVNNLSTRKEFRRNRRNRKTRYRQPRFNNRVHSKHKGWLAPSIEVKIQEHITSVIHICNILPISRVVVETAEFNLQLIKAIQDGKPALQRDDYKKGEQLGFYNVRQYIFWRDNYTCRCCRAHGKDVKLHVHHLETRKTGGNAPDNLITVCKKCHNEFHKGIISPITLKKRRRPSTRDAAFMGIMRNTLMQRLKKELQIPVVDTKGYITKYTRSELLMLNKTHAHDALAVAQGEHGFGINKVVTIIRQKHIFTIKPVRHHNRQLHKASILKGGIRKNNQAPKYVYGFRLFDKVKYNDNICFVWGRRIRGGFLLKLLNGVKIKDGVSPKKITLLEKSTNYLID